MTSLIRSVALGLSLATISLAQAGEPSAKQIAHQRALLQKHVDGTSFVRAGVPKTYAWNQLAAHNAALGKYDHVKLAGTRTDAILANAAGALFTKRGETIEPATIADLIRHDVASEDALTRSVHTRLLHVTGTPAGKDANAAILVAKNAATQQVAAVRQAKQRLTQLASGATATMMGALTSYAATVQRGRNGGDHVELVRNERGDRLYVLDGEWPKYAAAGDVPSIASTRDLVHMGIRTQADADAAVGKRLIELAGTGASHTDPAALRRAETIVAAKVADVAHLNQLLRSPTAHADLALLLQAHADLATREKTIPKSVRLATLGDETLVASSHGVASNGEVQAGALQVVKDGKATAATFADLERFHVSTTRQFDAAVGKAMFAIAPEELDVR